MNTYYDNLFQSDEFTEVVDELVSAATVDDIELFAGYWDALHARLVALETVRDTVRAEPLGVALGPFLVFGAESRGVYLEVEQVSPIGPQPMVFAWDVYANGSEEPYAINLTGDTVPYTFTVPELTVPNSFTTEQKAVLWLTLEPRRDGLESYWGSICERAAADGKTIENTPMQLRSDGTLVFYALVKEDADHEPVAHEVSFPVDHDYPVVEEIPMSQIVNG